MPNTASPDDYARAISNGPPTVAIIGVGAIGTVVADALSASSNVILCRRETSSAMSIEADGELRTVDATVASSPAGLGAVDWVVVTTKAQDTAAAAEWLDVLVGPSTRIVVLQNGIGHARRVSDWAQESSVLPGIVYIAAEKVGKDLVVLRKRGALAFARTPLALEFAALLGDRLPTQLVDDFLTESWSKLVMNSALNTITALTDRTMEVTGDPGVRPLVRSILVEGVRVAEAEGARFEPGVADVFLSHFDSLPRNSATSMQLDRRAGRPLEHEYLSGAVLEAAERHGIQVPNLRAVHGLIAAVAGRAAPVSSAGIAA